ncbi:MarR family winged helix-turn-helix transcriptional regulator [Aminipila luticellarii]|uniref:MarR family transcriptional regulator n=1 Tax=Aminipila luticellarii TaxID=2507160 RepID=A0A410PV01_9FIRM|nr:MarR family transcriptional regulator [Aminipila luticellarii]QAT42781.1 MarR family transcriptional regulator [Aminipila luticellarii]
MNYVELAEQFLQKSHQLQTYTHHKKIDGIMRGEAFVIIYISESGGKVLPSEISREMNISSARIATALNSLEKKGLITRQIDVSDRRKILVDLTADGKSLAIEHKQMALVAATHTMELLGETDAKEFIRIISKIIDLMPAIKEKEKE